MVFDCVRKHGSQLKVFKGVHSTYLQSIKVACCTTKRKSAIALLLLDGVNKE
jgi:hypothetical protein